MSVTIAIANQKGGVGKTTTAIELASSLKAAGYNVLAIDLDQQKNLTKYVSGDPYKNGVYEVLKGDIEISEAIQHITEFDLLSSSEKLSKADKEFGEDIDVLILKDKLKKLKDIYDFIIIDNNPARNVLLNMTYIASDYIIIPAEAEEGSFDGIRAVFRDLEKYKSVNWSNADVMGIILNKVEKTGMHEYGEAQIRSILQEQKSNAFIMRVRKSIAANECKTEGTSMQTGKKNSNPAKDYRDIAKEVIKRILEE